MNTPTDNELYMRTVKTYDHMVGQLNERIRGLQSQLDQAHADGAVLRGALELVLEAYSFIGSGRREPLSITLRKPENEIKVFQLVIALNNLRTKSESISAGADLLARYREAMTLVNLARNVHPEAGDQMSPDWAARADTLLATVKGRVEL